MVSYVVQSLSFIQAGSDNSITILFNSPNKTCSMTVFIPNHPHWLVVWPTSWAQTDQSDYTLKERERARAATHHYPILRDQDQFSSNRLRLIAGRRPSGATFREVRKRQVVMWLLVVVNWKGHLITYLTASRKYLCWDWVLRNQIPTIIINHWSPGAGLGRCPIARRWINPLR